MIALYSLVFQLCELVSKMVNSDCASREVYHGQTMLIRGEVLSQRLLLHKGILYPLSSIKIFSLFYGRLHSKFMIFVLFIDNQSQWYINLLNHKIVELL